MDDQFYRKLQPEKLLKKIAKGAAKNKRRTILLILGAIIFLYFLFDNKGLITRIKLERQKKEWIGQLKKDTSAKTSERNAGFSLVLKIMPV